MNIEGISAIVTGGASGLGQATAQLLDERGAQVTILDLSKGELPASIHFIVCDVTDEENVEQAVAQASDHFDVARIVVNCAGGGGRQGRLIPRSGSAMTREEFVAKFDLNVFGTFNVVRSVVEQMVLADPIGEERGVIVNTASISAFEGQPGQLAYSAAKGAIVSMTLPLARELANQRIRVMSVAPGVFETPRIESFSEQLRSHLVANVEHPARLGRPEEFAMLVEHIVQNPMLNGETIRLDAAMRMPSGS